eukprot:TRINITY_DN1809_c0_g1_i1.p1 TRINITY_DN1809_c0_g1~~TRINITY_DN1809_c0_g1_i1.p1  ORF type:complete len:205 (-),score=44.67 TRINITY_DN1809_c0_g1_i1:69-683(-)
MSGPAKVDIKVVLLGRAACGKTCFAQRFLHDRWSATPPQSTIGAAYAAKQIKMGKKSVTIGLWDTAGGERYESMAKSYYRNAGAAVLCYDLADSSSFAKLKYWVGEVKAVEDNILLCIVGTKLDLITSGTKKRAINQEEVKAFAKDLDASYHEVSSKTGEGVNDAFNDIVSRWQKKPKQEPKDYNPVQTISLVHTVKEDNQGCC